MAVNRSLLVVDVQTDFCEGGVLSAKDTGTLIAPLNALIRVCDAAGVLCIATRDWHPPRHASFVTHGGEWPVHCVQNTSGAAFNPSLRVPERALIIDKGVQREDEGYSAFDHTPLAASLRKRNVCELGICGIATEYCVKSTAIDAIALGFYTVLLSDLIRPIELRDGDGARAIAEVEEAGARVMLSMEWAAKMGLQLDIGRGR